MIDGADVPKPGDPEGLRRYSGLLGMAQRESASIASLATRMRLTQQSRYTAKSAATLVRNAGGPMKKPWIE